MWPSFLALLHTWCHGDLKVMLSLLSLMQAAVAFATWELLYRILGRAGAFIWLACVTLFYRTYVAGTFMSEQLGLPLGMLAAVILLHAWRQRSFGSWLPGLVVLTFALNARPGCYVVVAPLAAATFWRFRQKTPSTFAWRNCLAGLARRRGMIVIGLISLCMAANALSFRYLTNPPRVPSNFWMVLYGITQGGTWADSFRDLDEGHFDPKRTSPINEEELLYDFVRISLRCHQTN